MKKRAILFCCCLLCVLNSIAQQDKFIGTWMMNSTRPNDSTSLFMELQIAPADLQTLYPAQLTLRYLNFKAVYQLLLVKKNDQQLAISRNKFAQQEQPFSLGTWTILLNGNLNYSTSNDGKPVLTARRVTSKRYGIPLPALLNYDDETRPAAIYLSTFLKEAPIQLQQVNSLPWRSAAASKMVHSYDAPAYFGLTDTLYTQTGNAILQFSENNKTDNDTVSVMLNGSIIIDKMDLGNPIKLKEIQLDTGVNILCFFAENYGRVPPNTAILNLLFADKKFTLDFTSSQNMSATFIVAKIYFYPDKKQTTPPELSARKLINEKIQLRDTKLIDSIKVGSSEITLAIWDDAVEDGDSISLQINNEIYLPGIAVKKKPRFIKVLLYPGQNKIIFIADNLGSIAPNTSILELIDGKFRKAYMINTNLGQNNAIKIVYDYKPL
jgi:hypothetical protein